MLSRSTVVIATKNEQDTIGSLLKSLRDYTVVVVDDSTDLTPAIVACHKNAILLPGDNDGIAAAYVKGLRFATGLSDVIVQMDAGWTHKPSDVPRLLARSNGLVVGVRRFQLKGWRTLLSRIAAKMVGFPDATSGFRKWSREILLKCLPEVTAKGFAFQIEMLNAARKMCDVGTVPIEYRLTNSSLRPWMIWEAMKVWFKCLRD
jgi:dolichol-phosphate mannosyltransferase